MSSPDTYPQRPYEPGGAGNLGLLYQENARVAAAFWDWQHKLLTLFISGIGALLAIDAWMYDRHFGGYLAIPPAAATLLAAMCAVFAGRNRQILDNVYKIAAALEQRMLADSGLQLSTVYAWLQGSRPTYRRVLKPAFSAATVVFFALTVAALVQFA